MKGYLINEKNASRSKQNCVSQESFEPVVPFNGGVAINNKTRKKFQFPRPKIDIEFKM